MFYILYTYSFGNETFNRDKLLKLSECKKTVVKRLYKRVDNSNIKKYASYKGKIKKFIKKVIQIIKQ